MRAGRTPLGWSAGLLLGARVYNAFGVPPRRGAGQSWNALERAGMDKPEVDYVSGAGATFFCKMTTRVCPGQ